MQKYVFKPYNTRFPELFNAEKRRIVNHIQDLLIEHIGSTAVPGLGGKGIIDIAIAIKKDLFVEISKKLQELGYEFRPTFSTPQRLYFIIDLPDSENGTRRYHVHLTYPENSEWNDFIAFRDYLIANPYSASEYAEIKKHAALEADQNGEKYRKLKEKFFQQFNAIRRMHFKKASLDEKEIVAQWLQEPHVREFWDNSPEHFQDIVIFMNGRKEPSPYWEGIFDYWIGFLDNIPFCLVMTSEILPQQELLDIWKKHLSTKGKTFSIDFMIGNKQYLGKGLGAPSLNAFTQFIHRQADTNVDTFFIDPAESNPRAIHIYEKAGFKKVATFIRNGVNYLLMTKKM